VSHCKETKTTQVRSKDLKEKDFFYVKCHKKERKIYSLEQHEGEYMAEEF